MKTQVYLAGCLFAFVAGSNLAAQEKNTAPSSVDRLDSQFKKLVSTGMVVGAQLAVAHDGHATIVQNYGTVAVGSQKQVDEKTLFLIGSCSKPFASACVMSLIDDPNVKIALTDRIDQWIPAYGSLKVTNGANVSRAPTIEELLAHRAGIYSQKIGMTLDQTKWIRRFSHTLSDTVDGISTYELIAQPGQRYAYSGAGYCVLGRVAEIASDQPFEEILQQQLCKPLGLTKTTYFPSRTYPNETIATGRMQAVAPHLLGSEHRMPLIGGSLYSTADEMSLFGQTIIHQWNVTDTKRQLPISTDSMKELTRIRSPKSGYSLGWKVQQHAGRPIRLSHSGSLQSYRARLVLDLRHSTTIAACWTLARNKNPATLNKLIDGVLDDAVHD